MTAELTAPMVHKSEAKRIVFGPVLIPNEPDSDGDIVTQDQIERVAHKFVEDYQNIDLQHTLQNVGKLVESYITPVDLQYGELTVPKGSWMMGVRVTDEETWSRVQKGELTGFSIMGIPAALKSAEKSSSSQRTTLADLGDAWVVNAVSLVDEPAVPKAKWVAIKSKKEPLLTRIGKSLFGSKAKEVEIDMTPEELKALIAESVAEALAAQAEVQKEEEIPEEQVETPEEVEETPEDEGQEPEVKEEAPAEETPSEEAPEADNEPKDEEPEEEIDEEKEALKNSIKSLEAQVNLLMKSRRSNRLFGQDSTVVEKSAQPKADRDAFGRKL